MEYSQSLVPLSRPFDGMYPPLRYNDPTNQQPQLQDGISTLTFHIRIISDASHRPNLPRTRPYQASDRLLFDFSSLEYYSPSARKGRDYVVGDDAPR